MIINKIANFTLILIMHLSNDYQEIIPSFGKFSFFMTSAQVIDFRKRLQLTILSNQRERFASIENAQSIGGFKYND